MCRRMATGDHWACGNCLWPGRYDKRKSTCALRAALKTDLSALQAELHLLQRSTKRLQKTVNEVAKELLARFGKAQTWRFMVQINQL